MYKHYTRYVSTDYVPVTLEEHIIPNKIYQTYSTDGWDTYVEAESGGIMWINVNSISSVKGCAHLRFNSWKEHTKQEYLNQLRGDNND